MNNIGKNEKIEFNEIELTEIILKISLTYLFLFHTKFENVELLNLILKLKTGCKDSKNSENLLILIY